METSVGSWSSVGSPNRVASPLRFTLLNEIDPKLIEVVEASSNANAAERCARGEADACITTEAARDLYDLVAIKVFGSPDMVFFAGITSSGSSFSWKRCGLLWSRP